MGGGIILGSIFLIPRDICLEGGRFDNNMRRGTDSNLFRRIILKVIKQLTLEQYMLELIFLE
tara:strand:+ start:367 stop:552 length:186 start_codon:yes stop_codon:yes gene_type:complete